MTVHTVIPDIHADIDRLNASIACSSKGGKLLLLGDFIDAGKHVSSSSDEAVLSSVSKHIESERALAVMGNHELNAILFHSLAESGSPFREHSEKNKSQHRSFLNAFGVRSEKALHWTNWFMTALPLWREIDGLRLVHACWSKAHIAEISKRRPNGYLEWEDLEEIAAESTPFGKAVKTLVTGPEAKLPHPYTFKDYHGNERREVRLAWWNAEASTWPEATLSVPDPSELPAGQLPEDAAAVIYSPDAPPVLVGHYKMIGAPRIEHPKAASLDYPEQPCIYLWSGEDRLSQDCLQTI